MGKPGGAPARKAAGTAMKPYNGVRAVLKTPGERFDIPESVKEPEALEAWEEYWDDPVSSIITSCDRQLLRRWVTLLDDYYRLLREANACPTIETNSNGLLPNPLYKVALAMGNQIERLEIKLGIGPKNRLNLGIQVIRHQNAAAERDRTPDSGGKVIQMTPEPDDDPRMA